MKLVLSMKYFSLLLVFHRVTINQYQHLFPFHVHEVNVYLRFVFSFRNVRYYTVYIVCFECLKAENHFHLERKLLEY